MPQAQYRPGMAEYADAVLRRNREIARRSTRGGQLSQRGRNAIARNNRELTRRFGNLNIARRLGAIAQGNGSRRSRNLTPLQRDRAEKGILREAARVVEKKRAAEAAKKAAKKAKSAAKRKAARKKAARKKAAKKARR